MIYQLFDVAKNSVLPMKYKNPMVAGRAAASLHKAAIKQYGQTSPLSLYCDGKPAPAEDSARFNEVVAGIKR